VLQRARRSPLSLLFSRLKLHQWVQLSHERGVSGAELFGFPSRQVHEVLQGQLGSLEPHLLTDLVWSLCVLQQAKAPYLQRVLAPNFHAHIRGEAGVCGGPRTSRLGQGVGDAEPGQSKFELMGC